MMENLRCRRLGVFVGHMDGFKRLVFCVKTAAAAVQAERASPSSFALTWAPCRGEASSRNEK